MRWTILARDIPRSLICGDFSPDNIKIDGSFVREIGTNADSTSIVKSLIALSHDLGIRVVGEGIETTEQFHFLRRYNCEEGQGYLLCKPKLPNEVEDILLMANEGKIVAVSSAGKESDGAGSAAHR